MFTREFKKLFSIETPMLAREFKKLFSIETPMFTREFEKNYFLLKHQCLQGNLKKK